MIFTSITYYLILLFSVFSFFIFPKSYRHLILTISGIIFYSLFAGHFVFLVLALLILIHLATNNRFSNNYFLAIFISLATLIFFKYRHLLFPFLKFPAQNIAIPLAISFFTFEFIHFLIEHRRNHLKNISLSNLTSFIFFFPSLVSGPIKRFPHFNNQIISARLTPQNVFFSIYRIFLGLFKKLVLADTFATLVGSTFDSVPQVSAASPQLLWLKIFSYSFQILFDFSGYSDIAIGSAKLFGITIPENFNLPYFRSNIAQFWKHWHMTLYRWVVDYIFIPLGGSRFSLKKTILNTLIAMGISGIWHGAAWHFLLWGFYHGLLLVIFRLYRRYFFFPISTPLATIITFISVSLGWLLFIAPLDITLFALKKMFLLYL